MLKRFVAGAEGSLEAPSVLQKRVLGLRGTKIRVRAVRERVVSSSHSRGCERCWGQSARETVHEVGAHPRVRHLAERFGREPNVLTLFNSLRKKKLAPRARFELATLRLTAECSAVELPGNRAGRLQIYNSLRARASPQGMQLREIQTSGFLTKCTNDARLTLNYAADFERTPATISSIERRVSSLGGSKGRRGAPP